MSGIDAPTAVPDEQALALKVLSNAKAEGRLHPTIGARMAELIEAEQRPIIQNALAGEAETAPETTFENLLARFKAQYEDLKSRCPDNILAKDHSWETAEQRLRGLDAEKLEKLKGLIVYAVMEDGSLEFMEANSAQPPMFLKDKTTDQLQIIFDRNEQEMRQAQAKIDNARTHEWASVQEMLDWAKQKGFEVFGADTEDERWFGREMKLAEAASPDGLFVGKKGGPWVATALKEARGAIFFPRHGNVFVNDPDPGSRGGNLGLLRRLRV